MVREKRKALHLTFGIVVNASEELISSRNNVKALKNAYKTKSPTKESTLVIRKSKMEPMRFM